MYCEDHMLRSYDVCKLITETVYSLYTLLPYLRSSPYMYVQSVCCFFNFNPSCHKNRHGKIPTGALLELKGNTSVQKYLNLPYLRFKYCHIPPKNPPSWAETNQMQREFIHPSIGNILCAECWCCLSSLLGYWAQSWTDHPPWHPDKMIWPPSWFFRWA